MRNMNEHSPEYELELLAQQWKEDGGAALGHKVEVPIYVIEDAITRLKRYETIAANLTIVGNYLWSENLRKYGGRKIHEKETPAGVYKQKTYIDMCPFVKLLNSKDINMDDSFVELALQMSRFDSGDSSGLSQYLDKEDQIFSDLEWDDSPGHIEWEDNG